MRTLHSIRFNRKYNFSHFSMFGITRKKKKKRVNDFQKNKKSMKN